MHLIICIGNEARGDDGVARLVARSLHGVPGLRVISEPQLDVLMAEDLAAATRVTFVDAERREEPLLRVHVVQPRALVAGATTHALDFGGLLALADALYASAPPAEILTLAAPRMGHGETVSATAQAAAEEAIRRLRASAEAAS